MCVTQAERYLFSIWQIRYQQRASSRNNKQLECTYFSQYTTHLPPDTHSADGSACISMIGGVGHFDTLFDILILLFVVCMCVFVYNAWLMAGLSTFLYSTCTYIFHQCAWAIHCFLILFLAYSNPNYPINMRLSYDYYCQWPLIATTPSVFDRVICVGVNERQTLRDWSGYWNVFYSIEFKLIVTISKFSSEKVQKGTKPNTFVGFCRQMSYIAHFGTTFPNLKL